jgi:SnoaL-like domain
MPQESERVRVAERFLDSLIAGEPDMTLVTDDFEYEQHFGSTEGRYVGEEGLRRWIVTFYEIWDQASFRTEGVREAADRIALVTSTSVRGGLTGIEVELRTTGIWRFESDGRASRLDSFNEDDAAEAAFLAE